MLRNVVYREAGELFALRTGTASLLRPPESVLFSLVLLFNATAGKMAEAHETQGLLRCAALMQGFETRDMLRRRALMQGFETCTWRDAGLES